MSCSYIIILSKLTSQGNGKKKLSLQIKNLYDITPSGLVHTHQLQMNLLSQYPWSTVKMKVETSSETLPGFTELHSATSWTTVLKRSLNSVRISNITSDTPFSFLFPKAMGTLVSTKIHRPEIF